MSAAALPVTVEPTLSESLLALLAALARCAARTDSLLVAADAGNVIGATATSIRIADVSERWIPAPVLAILEGRPGLPWRVALPAMHGSSGRDPATLSALTATWKLEKVYQNAAKPDSPHGKRWIWPGKRIAGLLYNLEAFPAPPSLVVEAPPSLVAVWALTEPITVHGDVDHARALLLIRALCARVGAEVPGKDVHLAGLAVPLPGCACANQVQDIAAVVAFHPERIYALPAIEVAVGAKEQK